MIPVSTFIFLIGIFLPVPSEPPPINEEEVEDVAKAQAARHRLIRRRGVLAIVRLLLQGLGMVFLLIGLVSKTATPQNMEALVLLTSLFSVLILAVQRAEVNRRIITLFFMGFCGCMLWNYALYNRDFDAEAGWSIYLALLINYLFWFTIGRRYPVGSSKDIMVWGMDDR